MSKLERKKLLIDELNKKGLTFNYKNLLYQNYINGKSKINIYNIVKKMCENKYLFEYCNYKKIKEDLYNTYLNDINNVKINKNFINNEAKKIALKTWSNDKYPDIFPWENNVIIYNNIYKIIYFVIIYFLLILIIPFIIYNIPNEIRFEISPKSCFMTIYPFIFYNYSH